MRWGSSWWEAKGFPSDARPFGHFAPARSRRQAFPDGRLLSYTTQYPAHPFGAVRGRTRADATDLTPRRASQVSGERTVGMRMSWTGLYRISSAKYNKLRCATSVTPHPSAPAATPPPPPSTSPQLRPWRPVAASSRRRACLERQVERLLAQSASVGRRASATRQRVPRKGQESAELTFN